MVSIVITAYNVENTIEKAINSCLGQTYEKLEVVVVEDKSTDNTLKILESFDNHPKVNIVANEINVGAGMARRIGISQAKGEYILFLDGDDYIGDSFVESLVKAAKEYDADFVTTGVTHVRTCGTYHTIRYPIGVFEGREKVTGYFGKETLFLNTSLIKKSLFDLTPYCHRRYIEDVSTAIRLRHFANKVVYIDNPEYYYVENPNSLTHTSDPFKEALFRSLAAQDLIDFFCETDPEMIQICGFGEMYSGCIKKLRKMELDGNIERFQTEWNELTKGIIARAK